MKIRALIVDDEAPARRKLRSHLEGETDVEIAGEASDGLQAVEAIGKHKPDLVFLDIQMPGLTGFEVIEAVGLEAMPAVVFVTAYDQYALKAFEVEAVDYLLKPYDEERFQRAFTRAAERLSRKDFDQDRIERILEAVHSGRRYLQRLVVRLGERLTLVPVDDILRLTAKENYVEVVTPDGNHLLRDTLSHLESRLDPERFVRIHRSDIVNLDWVKELQPWSHGDYVVILKNGESLRLSRRYSGRILRSGGEA